MLYAKVEFEHSVFDPKDNFRMNSQKKYRKNWERFVVQNRKNWEPFVVPWGGAGRPERRVLGTFRERRVLGTFRERRVTGAILGRRRVNPLNPFAAFHLSNMVTNRRGFKPPLVDPRATWRRRAAFTWWGYPSGATQVQATRVNLALMPLPPGPPPGHVGAVLLAGVHGFF